MADLKDRIRAYALQNALRYEKAIPGKVIPKVLGEFPEQKRRMKELAQEIAAIVEEVNALPPEEREPQLMQLAPEFLERQGPKKRELPPLKNAVDGKVVTRLPPEPSKYNHLGHALTFIVNAIYAQKYEGRLILKFEDTNPEKVSQEFVDSMLEDIHGYLGIETDETVYVSDCMDELLAYAETLIGKEAAYMCFCPREEMAAKRRSGEACACRSAGVGKSLAEWKKFVAGAYMDGECVLRFAGEMDSKNTVLRDPVLFRAVKAAHFRKGEQYPVWPMYDFYSPITDALLGVTHVLRSNEFDLRVPLHERIKELLGLPQQEIVHYGRFNLTGATTKGREIREAIAAGEYIGWDDPRLVTLKALKRRGILREAYWELVKELGLSPYQVNLDFSKVAAINRRLLDPVANRYTLIIDPVELLVEGAPSREMDLHLHPDRKEGGRKFRTAGKYLLRKEDYRKFAKDDSIRLKDNFTFVFDGENGRFHSTHYDYRRAFRHNVTWLPDDKSQVVCVEIMMPDATVVKGKSEHNLSAVRPDDVIQFERFGFCRLDAIEKGVYKFWYTHD